MIRIYELIIFIVIKKRRFKEVCHNGIILLILVPDLSQGNTHFMDFVKDFKTYFIEPVQ